MDFCFHSASEAQIWKLRDGKATVILSLISRMKKIRNNCGGLPLYIVEIDSQIQIDEKGYDFFEQLLINII